ncbi:MAG TPA: helix-turn-helix transcriptional regulator [Lachnospiraceae bacterium]|nr:helix-turn-helix transcriptional regulator [Lachnospiraceae bacterium]
MTVQERIRSLREDNDLKQKTVANILDISQQVYSGYETGKHELPTRHVMILADYYKVSTDYLLGKTNYPGRADSLNEPFIKGHTLADFLSNSVSLNMNGRKTAYDYIMFLKNKR